MRLIDADALKPDYYDEYTFGNDEYVVRYYSEHQIDSAPSIDIDRPQGEWIEQEDDYHHYWECSECGMGVGLDDIRNFCPNCGARMKL